MKATIYSVNDINKYVKALLTSDESLRYIYVKGEISNYKPSSSGHIYFSLKDKDSTISTVMFSNYASKLSFAPKNGDEVVVLASIDAYVPRGSYSLFIYEMNLAGEGALLLELEKLKKKLAAEGLFDPSRKREINLYPKKIGLITAPNSAALKDLLTNIKRRYPIVDIYVFPSAVQGEAAPKELLNAFLKAQEYDLDTLIIGRGGGSNEDLSAFNDEKLVRAIASSKMPTIAAVGHEIDSTLVDFVADKRASTPTGAAELATIDQREIIQKLTYLVDDMKSNLREKITDIDESLTDIKQDLNDLILLKIENSKKDIEYLSNKLEALNPKSILARGYSITLDEKGNIIDDTSKIKLGDRIFTTLEKGSLISKVEEKK